MRLERFLERSAERLPEKTALVVGEERLTYAELNARADRMAAALARRGTRRGDRIVVLCDNTVDAVVSIFGVARAGAVFTLVNPSTKAAKLEGYFRTLRTKAFIVQDRLLTAAVTRSIEATPSLEAVFVAGGTGPVPVAHGVRFAEAIADESAGPVRPAGIDIDLAYVTFTSGSTGVPKGVMMTHQAASAVTASIVEYLEATDRDIILCTLPVSFSYGLYQVLQSVATGGTLVLEPDFTYPQRVLKRLAAEQATGMPLVPTMISLLLQTKGIEPGDLPDLRYLTNAAAAVAPAHLLRLQDLFPATKIYPMYGLTECARATYLPPEEVRSRPESCGKAIPNVEAYVVDADGNRAAPGEVGELVIRGSNLMKGYWENPAATDKALRPGPNPWERVLHTGDLFRADEDGYLYHVARTDDVIKTRGEKVSPKEIEDVLYLLPAIRDAAVVGIPDPDLGTVVKAFVVLKEGTDLTEQAVRRHCAQHLEDHLVPRAVEFRAELPKTDSGKLRRRDLRDDAASEVGLSIT